MHFRFLPLLVLLLYMVLLVHKLTHFLKHHSKLETHHRNPAADHEAVLGEFRSGVSSFLNLILLQNSEPPAESSEFWDLGKIQSCLEGLCSIHKAFVKTVAALDHPLCLWGQEITEEYLSYSFELLGLLNCVSSCLSHLSQARLSLSYALTQLGHSHKHLVGIPPHDLQKDFKVAETKQGEQEPADNKERVIHHALLITKRVSFVILGAILSGLSSDLRPFMELRKSVLGSDQEPLLLRLDSVFSKEIIVRKQSVVKEVKEINEAAAIYGDSAAAEKLGKMLQGFEEKLEGMRKQTDYLFKEVLAARSGLVDGLRCSNSGKVN